ncbi:complex I NDUFA9 subunit family protein [Caldimonas tepidiphila]|uniref:complex I NDUFA9 subunit family protein n=1 Tax=Caldimonas tepidiphila TaxID=2315841 RepID=UPI000E5ACAD7|nr:complex I NDUFA9 subunit family protein [Caldimonas tepidiphila]
MRNVLVLGGTGFLGTQVCLRLLERSPGGGRVVVPSRRIGHGRHLCTLPTVECLGADVHDDASLARLLRGIDAVISLVGVLHGDARRFEQVHAALPRRLAQACREAGVRRVVHVSAIGAAPDAPSNYLRSKAAGEAALREAAGLALTVLRPSVMFGERDHFLNLFARLQAVLPVMPLAGHDARFQPVWVNDVARAVVRCLDEPHSVGGTYECAGPRVYTLAELVRLAGLWSGHRRPVVPLPMALGRLQARLMELLPGEPPMSRDNLDSMRVPSVAGGELPGLQALGIEPAAMEAVAPFYLVPRRGRGRRPVPHPDA